MEDSIAGKTEDLRDVKCVSEIRAISIFMLMEERLDFQTMRRKAVGVPESKT